MRKVTPRLLLSHRMDAAVEHDGLAHVLEDHAAAADLVAGTDGHDAHRLVVFVGTFSSKQRVGVALGAMLKQPQSRASKMTKKAYGLHLPLDSRVCCAISPRVLVFEKRTAVLQSCWP